MKPLLTLWRREVADYLVSPVAYILGTVFLVVMGVGFWFLANVRLTSGASVYDLLQGLYGGVAWLAMLMVVPLLSMRAFTEEKKSGTLETLLTAPVRDVEVVLAKYLGVLTVYSMIWAPTLAYFPILNRLNDQPVPMDPGALTAAYLGVFLLGAFYLSIGVFCSSLTRNVILSSISTFAVISLLFLIGLLPEVTPVPWLREVSRPFSAVIHLMQFARGILDTRSVVFYLSSTCVMLIFTTRVLESRRWRA